MSYIPIRLGTLRGDQTVKFDVFIPIGERYIHYIHKEDPFDKERLTKLKSKGVKKLFITDDAEPSYLEYLDAGLNQLKTNDMNVEQKVEIAHDTMSNIAANASRSIENESNFRHTENRVGKVIDFLHGDKAAMSKLLDASGFAVDGAQHAVNVSTITVKLATAMGITAQKDLLELGMAALFHDVGKEGMQIDLSIPRAKMTLEQRKVYEEHPRLGAEKVASKPFINSRIVDLIMNHEEMGEGVGFPNKKRVGTLPVGQQILNLCNEYDRACTVNKIPPLVAMKQFFMEKIGLFDLAMIKVLDQVLKAR